MHVALKGGDVSSNWLQRSRHIFFARRTGAANADASNSAASAPTAIAAFPMASQQPQRAQQQQLQAAHAIAKAATAGHAIDSRRAAALTRASDGQGARGSKAPLLDPSTDSQNAAAELEPAAVSSLVADMYDSHLGGEMLGGDVPASESDLAALVEGTGTGTGAGTGTGGGGKGSAGGAAGTSSAGNGAAAASGGGRSVAGSPVGTVRGGSGSIGNGGARGGVLDGVLEEAVLSLPPELLDGGESSFMGVDRIEYMNALRSAGGGATNAQRDAWGVAAASTASASKQAMAHRLRGEVQQQHAHAVWSVQEHKHGLGGVGAGAGGGVGRQTGWIDSDAAVGLAAASRGGSGSSTPVFNLTLVTQTDASRLEYLSECSSRWQAPISAAVLLPPGATLASALDGREFEPHVTLLPLASTDANASYPINRLRNLAIRSVRTTHFIVLDVDLWPSHDLHAAAMGAPAHLLRSKYAALVVPAFELALAPPPAGDAAAAASFFEAAFDRVPSTLAELRDCLDLGECQHFYRHQSPETHATTPYKEWWQASERSARPTPQLEPLPIPCFKNARYEPYVVLPNLPSTPIYSEAFTGYGKNKIELVTHLRFAGFRFYALPHAFVTHMPHVKSLQKAQWEAGAHRKEMDRLYQKLVAQLISRYNRPRTPSCHPGRLL